MRAKLIVQPRGRVALGFRLFRLSTKNACCLVSRCGHQGLPHSQISRRTTAKAWLSLPRTIDKLPLTEPFGQDTLAGAPK
jgi:hypothetical protein